MNVYDQAHNLSQAIKESEEFKQFDQLKKAIDADPQLSKIVKDFQTKQFELQAKQMMGEQMDADYMAQSQQLYAIMMKDPMTAKYMEAQMRLSLMMNDVYKILGESMGLGDLIGQQ